MGTSRAGRGPEWTRGSLCCLAPPRGAPGGALTAVGTLLLENKTLFIYLPPEPPMGDGTLLVAQVQTQLRLLQGNERDAPAGVPRRPSMPRESLSRASPARPGPAGPPASAGPRLCTQWVVLAGSKDGRGLTTEGTAGSGQAHPSSVEAPKVRREGRGPHLLARPSRRRVWSLAPQHPRAAVRDTQTGAQGRLRTPVRAEGPVTLPRAAHGEVWWSVRPWEQL